MNAENIPDDADGTANNGSADGVSDVLGFMGEVAGGVAPAVGGSLHNIVTDASAAMPSTSADGYDPAAVQAVIDGGKLLISNLESQVVNSIEDCIGNCKVATGTCEACVTGCIDSYISKAYATVQKMEQKIQNDTMMKTAAAIGTAGAVGVKPPNAEQLIAVQSGGIIDPGNISADTLAPVATNTDGIPNVCPDGTLYDPESGTCITDLPPPACPAQQNYDPSSGLCVPNLIQCPPGTTYNPNLGTCDTPPPPSPPQPPQPPPPQPPSPTGPPPLPTGNPGTGSPPDCTTATTTQINCTTYPAIVPQHFWWTAQCVGNQVIVCTYVGPFPPTAPPGSTVYGPDVPPSEADIQAFQERCGLSNCLTTSPPVQPPPQQPPATTPPTPPPPPSPIEPSPNSAFHNSLCDVANMGGFKDFIAQRLGENFDPSGSLNAIGALVGGVLGGTVGKLIGTDIPFGNLIVTGLGAAIGATQGELVKEVLRPIKSTASECDTGLFYAAALRRGFTSLFGGWFNTVPASTIRSLDYYLNYLCPNTLPSAGEFNVMRATGRISNEQWEVGVGINGMCKDWQNVLVDMSKVRPNVMETITLWRKDKITDDDIDQRLTLLGVTDKVQRDEFIELSKNIPGPGDLVQFMTRDVEDQSVVDKYTLDGDPGEFERKYSGKIQEWGNAQGMDEETFKRYWRAHWHMPSDGQLYEALHRFRDDDRDPDDPNKDLTVTKQDVQDAIQINDLMPYWVKYVVALSYRPYQTRQVRQLYEQGILDEDDVRRAWRDSGYDAKKADNIAKATVKQSAEKRGINQGLPKRAEIIKWYEGMTIGRQDAIQYLTATGMDFDDIETSLNTSDARVHANLLKGVLSAFKKRYMTGEFQEGEIKGQLCQAGIDCDRLDDVINIWHHERDAKYKAPATGMLCKWYTLGYIDIDEFEQRVRNLGYSLTDASRIMQACQTDWAERRAKEVQALADKAERKATAQKKAALAAAKAAFPCKAPTKPPCPPGVLPPDPSTVP